jgi:hypothetical protein
VDFIVRVVGEVATEVELDEVVILSGIYFQG